MGLITEEVEVTLGGRNIKYLEDLGYEIPRKRNRHRRLTVPRGTKIKVKVEDLSKGSNTIVKIACDGCGKEKEVTYNYYNGIKHDDKCYCLKCSRELFGSGENHYNWNPDKTDEERENGRAYPEYKQFTMRVLARDNYTCAVCGKSHSGKMEVHHLNGYDWCIEERVKDENGVTLCESCHANFHLKYGYGKNTREQFEEWFEGFEQKPSLEDYLPTTRSVYSYEDERVFDSAKECADFLDIYPTNVYNVCNKRKLPRKLSNGEKTYSRTLSIKGRHLFWLDEYEKMTKEEIEKVVNRKRRGLRKVVCLNTKKVYNMIEDIKADYPHVRPSDVAGVCNGRHSYAGKDKEGNPLTWAFYEDYIKNPDMSIKTYSTDENKRKVICINTLEIFDSVKEAAKSCGRDGSTMTNTCQSNLTRSCGVDNNGGKLFWMYYDEYLKNPDVKINYTNKNFRKTVCLETGKVYDKLADAKIDYPKINPSCIGYCCRGQSAYAGKDENGNPLHWMYYEDYIKQQKNNNN